MNEEKPTHEDWEQVRAMIAYIGAEHSVSDTYVYAPRNKYLIDNVKARDEREKMKLLITAARKRRQEPDFKYEEWK